VNDQTSPDQRVFVRFGDRPNEELHLETAEKLLTAFKKAQPKLFGKYLQMALGLDS
jgi:hypothetical protein